MLLLGMCPWTDVCVTWKGISRLDAITWDLSVNWFVWKTEGNIRIRWSYLEFVGELMNVNHKREFKD